MLLTLLDVELLMLPVLRRCLPMLLLMVLAIMLKSSLVVLPMPVLVVLLMQL